MLIIRTPPTANRTLIKARLAVVMVMMMMLSGMTNGVSAITAGTYVLQSFVAIV